MLSPVLFCVYIDDLLQTLSSKRIGCCIGRMFTGVLAYADDIVLLALSAQAMRIMLSVCEEYAKEFSQF